MPLYREKSHEELRWEDYQHKSVFQGSVIDGCNAFDADPVQSSATQFIFQIPARQMTTSGAGDHLAQSPLSFSPMGIFSLGGTASRVFRQPGAMSPSTSVFGHPAAASTSSSLFGQPAAANPSTSVFGQPTTVNPFAASSQVMTFTSGGGSASALRKQSSFSDSPLESSKHGSVPPQTLNDSGRVGSRITAYAWTYDSETNTNILSITAMPFYREKSHEELRWEDYQHGDRDPVQSSETQFNFQIPVRQMTTSGAGDHLAQRPFSFSPMGISSLGGTASRVFRQPGAMCPSTSAFGHPAAASTSSSLFGLPAAANPSTSFFGQPTTVNPFAASSQVMTFTSGGASASALRKQSFFSDSPLDSSRPGSVPPQTLNDSGRVGSRITAYAQTYDSDTKTSILSISAMPLYKDKRHEELRWEDYQHGDRGGAHHAGQTPVVNRIHAQIQNNTFSIQNTFVQPTLNQFPLKSPIFQQTGFASSSSTPISTPSTTLHFSGFTTSRKTESARLFQSFPYSFQTSPLQLSPSRGITNHGDSQPFQNNPFAVGNTSAQPAHNPLSPKSPKTGWICSTFSSTLSLTSTTLPFSGFVASGNTESVGPFQNPSSTAQTPTVQPSPFNGFTSHGNKPDGLFQTSLIGQVPPLQPSQSPELKTPGNTQSTWSIQQTPPSLSPLNIPGLTSLVNTQPASSCPQTPIIQTSPSPGSATPGNTQTAFQTVFPIQTQNATGNYHTQQEASSSSIGGTSNISDQGITTQSSTSQQNFVGETLPTTNFFGPLLTPRIPIGHVCENPVPVRMATLLAPSFLSQRRIQLPARKYHPNDGPGPKVQLHSQNEAAATKSKGIFFIPRENPRALVINPSEQWPSGGISTEKQSVLEGSHILANENGDEAEDGHIREQNHATLSPFGPANNLNRNHSDDAQKAKDLSCLRSPGHTASKIMTKDGTDIEALMPKLNHADYYTEPHILDLAANERVEPGFCCRVKGFLVGRRGYGNIKFDGETDVRGIDLEMVIQFNEREVVVYKDERVKPPVGQGLNKPSEVTLLNVKCISKKTGQQYTEGSKVEKYKEMLVAKAREQGAEFVSFDAVKGEWRFKVKHF